MPIQWLSSSTRIVAAEKTTVITILIQRENPGLQAVTRNLRFLVARQM